MKIFFSGSIRGGTADKELYGQILSILCTFGEIVTEHGGKTSAAKTTDRESHDRDIEWIRGADVIVAEVTVPSIGVGYEVGRAVGLGKSVICIHRITDKKISAMIAGNSSVISVCYEDLGDLQRQLAPFLTQRSPNIGGIMDPAK